MQTTHSNLATATDAVSAVNTKSDSDMVAAVPTSSTYLTLCPHCGLRVHAPKCPFTVRLFSATPSPLDGDEQTEWQPSENMDPDHGELEDADMSGSQGSEDEQELKFCKKPNMETDAEDDDDMPGSVPRSSSLTASTLPIASNPEVDELHAERALCRLLHSRGWTEGKIVKRTRNSAGLVWRALKNCTGTSVGYQPNRDDLALDEQIVDRALLNMLIKTESDVSENRDDDAASFVPSESEVDELEDSDAELSKSAPRENSSVNVRYPRVCKNRQPRSASTVARASGKRQPPLNHSDRTLCRILYGRGWTGDEISQAFGRGRTGGYSAVCNAIKNVIGSSPQTTRPGTDDISLDEEIVDKAKLAEFLTKENAHVVAARASSRKNTPKTREAPNATSLKEFLSRVQPEMDLSDRVGLFNLRGIKTVEGLRAALKREDDRDVLEAMRLLFGEDAEGYVGLAEFQLVGLLQALRKLNP
ncbi:hypothetical protein C8F01DRAFT_1371175 [Mycena amicta]|nr:hypothetical protein C8F01DRAFT_1371175 [Mycena amicta]